MIKISQGDVANQRHTGDEGQGEFLYDYTHERRRFGDGGILGYDT